MATRKKSMRDFSAQYNRILHLSQQLADRDGTRAAQALNTQDAHAYVLAYNQGASRAQGREQKAFDTAVKYIRRIKNSKSYQNAKNKAAGKSAEQSNALRDKAQSRKYSSRTYMGKNAG